MRDLRGIFQGVWFANEALNDFAVSQRRAPYSQGRGYAGYKTSKLIFGHSPHFDLNTGTLKSFFTDEARLRRLRAR